MGVGATVSGHERQALGRVDATLNVHTARGRSVELTAEHIAHSGPRQPPVLNAVQKAIHKSGRWRGKGQATGIDLALRADGKTVAVDEEQIAANVAVGQATFQPAVHAHLGIAHDVDPPVGLFGHQHLDLIALAHRKVGVGAEGIAIAQALCGDGGLLALCAHHRVGLPCTLERGDHRLPQNHGAGCAQSHSRRQGQRSHLHQQAATRHPGTAPGLALCHGRRGWAVHSDHVQLSKTRISIDRSVGFRARHKKSGDCSLFAWL